MVAQLEVFGDKVSPNSGPHHPQRGVPGLPFPQLRWVAYLRRTNTAFRHLTCQWLLPFQSFLSLLLGLIFLLPTVSSRALPTLPDRHGVRYLDYPKDGVMPFVGMHPYAPHHHSIVRVLLSISNPGILIALHTLPPKYLIPT
jgi:hypothetical protein